MDTFNKQFAWATGFNDDLYSIIKRVSGEIINIRIANDEEDTKQVTDFVIQVSVGSIAARVRNLFFNRPYTDVTIRSRSRWGGETEIHKILRGEGKYYVYYWAKSGDWVFYDLDSVRKSGILENKTTKMNTDNSTGFVSVNVKELDDANSIIDCSARVREYITPFNMEKTFSQENSRLTDF